MQWFMLMVKASDDDAARTKLFICISVITILQTTALLPTCLQQLRSLKSPPTNASVFPFECGPLPVQSRSRFAVGSDACSSQLWMLLVSHVLFVVMQWTQLVPQGPIFFNCHLEKLYWCHSKDMPLDRHLSSTVVCCHLVFSGLIACGLTNYWITVRHKRFFYFLCQNTIL